MEKRLADLLETMNNYLPKLINASDLIPEKFQLDKKDEGFQILGHYIEGIAWLIDGIQVIKSTNQDYLTMLEIDILSEKLKDLEEALNNEDYVLFSDLLQYEMKEILIVYQTEIVKLSEAKRI